LKLYQLRTKQELPISLEKAWKFFSDPKNLKDITPNEMNFNIISGADKSIYAGQIIQYKVSPVLGINLKWVTEITHVKENEYFVDEQRFGPYSLWHHKHFFKKINGGILMEDIVDYKIPYGLIGQFAHVIFVKKKLKKIFNYRHTKLEKLFGKM
tara:strand:+ start:9419 stop:9880 length:462 start_codon:yes stop_codon:yes gene_type:complete